MLTTNVTVETNANPVKRNFPWTAPVLKSVNAAVKNKKTSPTKVMVLIVTPKEGTRSMIGPDRKALNVSTVKYVYVLIFIL